MLTLTAILIVGREAFLEAFKEMKAGYIGVKTFTVLNVSLFWLISTLMLINPTILISIGFNPTFSSIWIVLFVLSAANLIKHNYNNKTLKRRRDALKEQLAALKPQHTFFTSSRVSQHSLTEEKIEASFPYIKGRAITKYADINTIQANHLLYLEKGARIITRSKLVCATNGQAKFDTSCLTGESKPTDKVINDILEPGFIYKGEQPIAIQSLQSGAESDTSKRITILQKRDLYKELKEEDAITAHLVGHSILVLIIACIITLVVTLSIWYFLGPVPHLGYLISAFLSILLVFSCPSTLIFIYSTPFQAVNSAIIQQKITLQSEDLFNLLKAIKEKRKIAYVFDKTGTLTDPDQMTCEMTSTDNNISLEQLAHDVTPLQQHHGERNAYARAYLKQYKTCDVYTEAQEVKLDGTRGITATVNSSTISIGSKNFILNTYPEPITANALTQVIQDSNGSTVSFIVKDNQLIGYMKFEAPIRPRTAESISAIKTMIPNNEAKVIMLTGDNEAAARKAQRQIPSIDHIVHSTLKNRPNPQGNGTLDDKLEYIKYLKTLGYFVVFTGDGANDEASVAAADLGVAISEKAVYVANNAQVILNSSITSLHHIIKAAKAIKQATYVNLVLLAISLTCMVFIGSGSLFFIAGLLLDPLKITLLTNPFLVMIIGFALISSFFLMKNITQWFNNDKQNLDQPTSHQANPIQPTASHSIMRRLSNSLTVYDAKTWKETIPLQMNLGSAATPTS